MRSLEFDINAFEDLSWWVSNDAKTLKRIMKIISEIAKDPFKGLGKPEPLKNEFRGCWSRRINEKHRIVYQVFDEKIRILACRFHYS